MVYIECTWFMYLELSVNESQRVKSEENLLNGLKHPCFVTKSQIILFLQQSFIKQPSFLSKLRKICCGGSGITNGKEYTRNSTLQSEF